jgi:hypothetical protein
MVARLGDSVTRHRTIAAPLAVLLLFTSAVTAEEVPESVRVRVATRSEGKVIGTLVRSDRSGLTLAVDGAHRTFALDDVTGFEVSRGRRSHKTKWALIGLVPWVVVATIVLADGGPDESGIASPQSALLLGGGVAAGLVIGSHRKTDVWERAEIPGAASRWQPGGLTVGVSLSF